MENLIYSLNASLPIFLVMAAGWGLKRIGLLNESFAAGADKLVFRVTVPLLLFNQIRAIDVWENFDWRYLGFCMGATAAAVCLLWPLSHLLIRDKASVGAFVQACYRSSAAILGVAFIENAYGQAGMASLMVLGSVPLFNLFAVLILTVEGGARGQELGRRVAAAARGIATNPMILGILAGLLASLLRLRLPVVVDKTFSSLAGLTTPLALLAIGIEFKGKEALGKLKLTALATVIKLLALPAIFLPMAAALGFRQELLMGLVVMLGSPATPMGYVMAREMGGDEVLASSAIMLTTLCSAVTLTFWIFLFRALGYL